MTKLYGLGVLAVGALMLGPARAQSSEEWVACMEAWADIDPSICDSLLPPPPPPEPEPDPVPPPPPPEPEPEPVPPPPPPEPEPEPVPPPPPPPEPVPPPPPPPEPQPSPAAACKQESSRGVGHDAQHGGREFGHSRGIGQLCKDERSGRH
jgi:hypothetical protein